MAKPVVDFMENYTQTPSRIYDLYQYYMGGGKSGVPNVNQPPPGQTGIFSGGQGGGGIGALQVGNPMMNPQTFYQQGYDKFLQRTQPELFAKDTFFGFPTTRQDVNPVDAGAYLAAGMEVPTALTKAGIMQQQVAKAKTGISNLMSNFKGPLTGILSSMDRFSTLPQLDQQFIERAMGYRGPTVFGENTGGNYKDPFGLNVRSAFGNYAERVTKEANKMTDLLSGRMTDKYQDMFDTDDDGLSFDPTTGKFVGTNAAAVKKANQMNKMNLAKYNFYTGMNKQRQFNKKIYEQNQKVMKAQVAKTQARVNRNEDNINRGAEKGNKTGTVNPHSSYGKSQGYTGGTHNPHTDTGWSGSSKGGNSSSGGGTTDSNSPAGGGGYCFDPNTLVQMADGSEKKIKEIQLGDQTKGGEVTGVFQFKASDEIHDYKGVVVAGSHYVKEDGKFIMVQDSPISVKIDKIPVVYSLDTTGRRIFINDIEFADYNGDGVAKNFLTNAGVDLTGFDTEVLRQIENRLI